MISSAFEDTPWKRPELGLIAGANCGHVIGSPLALTGSCFAYFTVCIIEILEQLLIIKTNEGQVL